MSFVPNQKEEAQIIADAIHDGLGDVAGHLRDAIIDSVDTLGERLTTDAEADSLGKRPAYITDGLFAIARAINRVAQAMEESVRAVDRLDQCSGDDWKDDEEEMED